MVTIAGHTAFCLESIACAYTELRSFFFLLFFFLVPAAVPSEHYPFAVARGGFTLSGSGWGMMISEKLSSINS